MTVLFRPGFRDLAAIGVLTGRVLVVVGLVMLVPAALGMVWDEHDAAAGMAIGACTALIPGLLAQRYLPLRGDVTWTQGMVVSALAWLVAPFAGAVALFLSGHYGQFLDAYFDAMSGFTTTGLAVISDLDHLPDTVNLWRHLMQFLGGQGLLLTVLSLFSGGGAIVGMYAGEAREDKILPHVRRTARFIWRASATYAVVGITALVAALLLAGLPAGRAAFHAVVLFFAAFDTGGYSPLSSSVISYHSAAVEAVLVVLMLAGSVSFAVHYRLWTGQPGELVRNLEARVLAIVMGAFFVFIAFGFVADQVHGSVVELLRRGGFQLVSAQTTTGLSNVPTRLFSTSWGVVAPAGIVMAMTIGGMSGATAGGIKALRVGLVAKVIAAAVRRALLPADAEVVQTYHHGQRQVLRLQVARAATVVLLLYLALYLFGTLVALFYGYPLDEALFESTASASSAGFSIGIVSGTMPAGIQIAYILQMWVARLEFIAAFALVGFVWSMLRSPR